MDRAARACEAVAVHPIYGKNFNEANWRAGAHAHWDILRCMQLTSTKYIDSAPCARSPTASWR